MKVIKSLAAAGLLCMAGAAFGQQAKVTGDIKGLGDVDVNIHYYEGAETKTGTIKTTGGKFSWTGNMPAPQKVTLMFPNRAAWVYLEPGNISIKGTADSLHALKVTGSKTQTEADAFEASQKHLDDQLMPLYQKYGKLGKEEQLALEEKINGIRKQMREMENTYIAAHPESAVSLAMVTDRAGMGSYQDIQTIYEKLGPKMKASAEGKRLSERLTVLKRSSIGEQMLNFTQNDMEGKPVSFASFKGKYVLVDFWASWCGPCRAENPNVLKAYNTYKDKNFTVVGISLDDKGDNWKKAVKDDGMPWTQLSDLKGWKNEVSTYYGIMGIPSTLLVDPQGKIIAKDLRGEMLNKKLEELFKN
ncbi:TlpA disulfide reductase family protein [Pedobacter frigoris]|uniref:AhpC/TSA family protein n=1 Tax=Pedobacter frigoris TaxID=2571272 RepID=A0A4U1CDV4_9SPHI|nr:TlpA disulfide reductase family protein [Pedobacter frigoris]TKC04394.1 AhpC/TSA family protein [Pedobacter frigoris]